jgi:hypothetical protein
MPRDLSKSKLQSLLQSLLKENFQIPFTPDLKGFFFFNEVQTYVKNFGDVSIGGLYIRPRKKILLNQG